MKKRLFTHWLAIFACLFLFWTPAQAGADPPVIRVLDGSIGQMKVDSQVTVRDAKFYEPAYNTLLKKPYRIESIVALEINEGLPIYLQDNFQVTAGLSISYKDANGNVSTDTRSLTITYNKNGNYNHRVTYIRTGFYEVTVRITSIQSNATTWDALKGVKLVNELRSFPEYVFTFTGNGITGLSDSAWTSNTDRDDLPVWWMPSIGADEYDLEWAYVDDAALAAGHYNDGQGNLSLNKVFANNASRVSITGTAYRIPLIYDSKGHMFYRVRAVQNQNNGGRLEAMWTTQASVGHGRFNFDGHERTFNWQATTTFAEEGKRKSVVQYYDGSLRGRQTVTKDNSTNRTIVAESFYDYQGRPVIQVLPAPTLNTIVGYTQNFNRGINRAEYDKNLFDSLGSPGQYCEAQAAPMDSALAGAAHYYSSLSPFKDSGVHKYVPLASGYPFTEVEYTPDNTGSISRQSGVGRDFRLGSGHETRYFYNTPDQRELDALFGTEVGDRSHYFKNTVRDANGQYSISYVDMHGRTIATALAGNPAGKLEKLTSNQSAMRTETLTDPQSAVIKDLVMETQKSLGVTEAGNHFFAYSLDPLRLQLEGCDTTAICYDCLYDLEITITDACNNQTFGGKPFDTVFRNFSLNNIDTSCSNGTGFSLSFTTWLPEGTYEITKKLSVSRYAMDYYRDSVFLAGKHCKDLDDFIAEQRAIAQQAADCKPTCEGCVAGLGTWTQYWQQYRQTNGILDVDTALYRNMALQAYTEAEEDCKTLCDSVSEINDIRKAMLMDMTPSSGQYANLDQTEDRYSVFFTRLDSTDNGNILDTLPAYSKLTTYLDAENNPAMVYDEGAGKMVTPQQLSAELFAQRFQSSWAEALLPLHPEYEKLKRYELLWQSHEWDRKFEAINTYAEARAAGYLNPTDELALIPFFGLGGSGKDPLYGLQNGAFHGLRDSLNKYRIIRKSKYDPTTITLSLWSVATLSVMCPGEINYTSCITQYNTNASAFNEANMCAAELDMAWRTFRQLYLEIKRGFVNRWIKAQCAGCKTPAQIVASGHQPHFSDGRELISLQPLPDRPSSKADAEALVQKAYEDNCKSYVQHWIGQLSGCYSSGQLNNDIIPALIAICKEGADLEHPYGASSVKPSSSHSHRSFEAYLEYYNAANGITNKETCNAYGIIAPKPYDQQAKNGNKPVYSKPDDCECTNISQLYTRYKPKKSRYGSFSNYLREVYKTEVADSVLNTLLSLCGNTDFPAADCDYVSSALWLPPLFQCNTGDVCVDCDKMKQLNAEFKQKFPGIQAVIDTTGLLDSVQLRNNTLYEQFLNHRLGFAKTAKEYLQFGSDCGINPAYDSLQNLIDSFEVYRRRLYGVRFELKTENGTIYKDHAVTIQNGSLQLPAAARVPGGSSEITQYLTGGLFCGSGGYATEVRYRCLGPGSGSYYANLGHSSFHIQRSTTTNEWGPPGVYLIGYRDQYYNKNYGWIYGGDLFSAILVSTDTSYAAWHTVKGEMSQHFYRLYFDGVKVLEIPRDASLPILNFIAAGFGSHGRYFSIDYWKVWDGTGQLRYVEDFNNPSKLALFDPVAQCPAGSVPDCQTLFTTYFNQQRGTSYTYAQIQALYTAAGVSLVACETPGSTLRCDTLATWLSDYKKYGGIPHLDASGADTTHWKPNFNGSTYQLGVPLAEVIKNGVLKLPDYYADTLSDAYPRNATDFDYYDTLCLPPAGFDFVTRIKLPDNLVIPNFYNARLWINLWSDKPTSSSGSILTGFNGTGMANGAATCTRYGEPTMQCLEYPVPLQSFNDWRVVKWEFRGTRMRYYIDNTLLAELTLDAPFTKLNSIGIQPWAQKAQIDYIRLVDVNGRHLYNEEFNDAHNLAVPDPSLKCGGCEVNFTNYFNQRNNSNLSYQDIASLYAQCGVNLDACDRPDLTLCGREQPVFPPVLLDAIDNCSDSAFFIQSKAQDLYVRYVDSLKGDFEYRYLAKCMQAYKYERFTVTHKVNEYHYTLYYYDQSGNLVKTIAPEGIRPNYDSLWLDSVATARLTRQIKVPAHVMPTQYRYNTLNQVIAQKSPDGGKTDFWYDRLGRLALSRNARQLAMSNSGNKYYSYTKYDILGRITEVGQLKDTIGQAVNDTFTRSEVLLLNWHDKLLGKREQVTNTVYDIPYGFSDADPTLIVAQANVRNRVSYVIYTDLPGAASSFNHASFYSYDIHGNVDTLLQDYGQSATRPNIMNQNANRWKKIVYEYDLISGKVNKVMYQPRYSDQFTHRYLYDAENRLTEVQTSFDGFTWEREARYEYYLHGPLARTILGQQQVQGVDYAYTLQGWLKGVNSTGATATHDIGSDGKIGDINQYIARDALGFNLNYFHGDYQTISPDVNPFPAYRIPGSGLPDNEYRPLYNGNISSMATSIRRFETQGHVPIFYNYRYDQLNRYVRQDAYFNFNKTTNSYGAWTPDSTFRERVAYDANGNIQKFARHAIGQGGALMDNLTYKYYPGTNQLRQVNDVVADNSYGTNPSNPVVDIDNQTDTSNYVYDAIGNLIQDKAEKITNIQWNVYGKITEITRNALTTDRITTTRTRYTYDAQGNRISKAVKSYNKTNARYEIDHTWYVRDAQGNILSTYTTTAVDTSAGADLGSLALKQADVQLYGSSRLGSLPTINSVVDNANNTGPWINPDYRGSTYYRGYRQYELTNHLGNVLTTISDRKIPVYSNGSLTLPGGFAIPIADYFEPDMVEATDYYPFGMVSRANGAYDKYRFGFNGKENDNEVKGFAQQQDYGMRVYDPRVGRFLSTDPLTKDFPWYTPYQFAGNRPIVAIDLDGLEPQEHPYQLKAVGKPHLGITDEGYNYEAYKVNSPTYGETWVARIEQTYDLPHGFKGSIDVFLYNNKETGWQPWQRGDEMSIGHRRRVEGAQMIGIGTFATAATAAAGFAIAGLAPLTSSAVGEATPVVTAAIKKQAFNLAVRGILAYYRYLPYALSAGKLALEISDESGQFSNVNIGASVGARVLIDETRLAHIFRKKTGHISEATEEAKELLQSVANSADNLLGVDKYGSSWYHKLNEKGQQIWTQVRDGKIINGGINNTPKEFNSSTGLSALTPPGQK